jgi:hypothetical protein
MAGRLSARHFRSVDRANASHPFVIESFKENIMLRSSTAAQAASIVAIGMFLPPARVVDPIPIPATSHRC